MKQVVVNGNLPSLQTCPAFHPQALVKLRIVRYISSILLTSNPTRNFYHLFCTATVKKNYDIVNNWFTVSVLLSSNGRTREFAKQEGSVTVARGDSLVRL